MMTHHAIYAAARHFAVEYFGLEALAIVAVFGLVHLCIAGLCGPKRRKRGVGS
jgi:hypothetical protein